MNQEKKEQELQKIDRVVDDFAKEMKARLRDRTVTSYTEAMDDQDKCPWSLETILKLAPISSGREVDTANRAMILWFLRKQEGLGGSI